MATSGLGGGSQYNEMHEQVPLMPPRSDDDGPSDGSDDGVKPSKQSHVGYSLPVAICFAINYQVGAGVLGLPYEFYSAGYVLGSLMIAFIAFLTYITNIYIVDGIIRAEAVTTLSRGLPNAVLSKYDLLSRSQIIKRQIAEVEELSASQKIQESYVVNKQQFDTF